MFDIQIGVGTRYYPANIPSKPEHRIKSLGLDEVFLIGLSDHTSERFNASLINNLKLGNIRKTLFEKGRGIIKQEVLGEFARAL